MMVNPDDITVIYLQEKPQYFNDFQIECGQKIKELKRFEGQESYQQRLEDFDAYAILLDCQRT